MPSFNLFILTCPQRTTILEATLKSLTESDWNDAPTIVNDERNLADVVKSQAANAYDLLQQANNSTTDYIIFAEDDIEFNKHIRHNLNCWEPLRECRADVATLYEQGKPWRQINNTSLRQCQLLGGSQAIVIKTEFVRVILGKWFRFDDNLLHDLRIFRSLLDTPARFVHVHTPNLVQHRLSESTWNGPQHQSETFDINWRAE